MQGDCIMQTLKEKRERLGLKQSDMARLMGVHRQTYVSWERGEKQMSAAPARLLEMIEDLSAKHPNIFEQLAEQFIERG